MRNHLTSLAPTGPSEDVTVHIVLNDYGKLGIAYVETDAAKADQATIVEYIVTGEISRPLRIIAFNTHEGWSRDITEDIAVRIFELNQQGRELSAVARDFVERAIGKAATVSV